jgi:cell division protein FtsW (lipid II flippase)
MSRSLGLRPSLRTTELGLIIWPAVLAAVGLVTVAAVRSGATAAVPVLDTYRDTLVPAFILAGLLFAVHLWLSMLGSRADQFLLPVAAALSAIGLVIVSRLEPEAVARQSVWLGLGMGLTILTLALLREPSWLKRYKYTWAILGVGILLATLVLGRDPHGGGARLWISFGPVQFQPSEILKVLLAIFLAGYLDDKRELLSAAAYRLGPFRLPPLPYLGPLFLMWGISLLLLLVLKDLGLALLLFGLFLSMLYVASSRPIYVWGGLLLFVAGAFLAYNLFGYVQVRVTGWLDPWSDPTNTTYQMVQSLLAFASGGVLGTGLGYGQPTLIPASMTDFPFAAIGEELGLAGSLAVLALYFVLIYRGYLIALRAFDPFQQLLATGLTTIVALQVFVIVGGNIKLIPLTGITLPFISYGGSSLVTNLIIVGILLAISDRTERQRV